MTDRTGFIGSTDLAAILGKSPWKTALDVYFEKIGEPSEEVSPERAKLFRRGKLMEPVVVDMLIDEYPEIRVTRRSSPDAPNRHVDPEFPYLVAEIDFEVIDEDGVVGNGEVKTVHPFAVKKWGDENTDQFPIQYAAQVMFGLMVTQRDRGTLAALFGSDNLRRYQLYRDDETIAAIREKCVRFWNDNVLARVPPEPVNMDDYQRLYSRINGRPLEIDAETFGLIERLRVLREARRDMKQGALDIELQIAERVVRAGFGVMQDNPDDDAVLLFEGREVCTWKRRAYTSLDQRAIAQKYPDLFSKFRRTTHRRVFAPKRLT